MDISQYDTIPKKNTNSITLIDRIFDKQTNKRSNSIKRQNN